MWQSQTAAYGGVELRFAFLSPLRPSITGGLRLIAETPDYEQPGDVLPFPPRRCDPVN